MSSHSHHGFATRVSEGVSKLTKNLKRKKKPLTEVPAAREGEVVAPVVVQDRVEVPVEEGSRLGVPDVMLIADEGRAGDVFSEIVVADLAGIGGASPTPRDDETDGKDRTKGDIFLSIASPTSKVLDYAAEASGFAPLKVVAASLKFIVDHAETAGENKKDAQNLFSRLERTLASLETPLDDPEENARRVILSRQLEKISQKLGPLGGPDRDERFFNECRQFLKAPENAKLIQECLIAVDHALSDYQLSLVQRVHQLSTEQRVLLEELRKLSVKHINYDERTALDKLSRAKDVGFDASGSDTRSNCLSDTRVDILRDLMRWAADPAEKQVCWLNGHAGSGKSTIAQSFAEQLASKGRLGASFFCSRGSVHASDRTMIFPTIAFQLATSANDASPQFREAVLRALEKNQDIASLALNNQFEELIVHPADESSMETVIVIDALDECKDDATTSIILSYLAQHIARIPRIKFFITSRSEPHIRMGFRLEGLRPITDVMILHEVAATSVDKDIRLFLQVKLNDPAARARRSDLHLPNHWPREMDIDTLAAKASGLFIFAATAVKLIFDKDSDPQDQLNILLSKTDSFAEEGMSGLDFLYADILARAYSKINDRLTQRLRSMLGFLVVACDLVSMSTMADILGFTSDTIKTSLRSLHSLLLVPEDTNLPIRFYHKSFPDFLLDSTRCTNPRFYIDRDAHHLNAATRCLETMEGGLKKNTCGLPRYAMNDEVTLTTLDRCIPEALRYSCRYWAAHLLSDGNREAHLLSDAVYENGHPGKACALRRFFTTRQLQWIEVLGLLRDLRTAVNSLTDVHEWLISCDDKYKTLIDWADDGRRFILNAFDIVDASVAHIYHSALPFASNKSLLKSYHATDLACEAAVVIGSAKAQKGGPIRTVQTPGSVYAVEYSPDGTMIAAGGHKSTYLFRSATGEQMGKFEHESQVNSLSFSHDSQTLATACGDSIALWDVRTGVSTIPLHSEVGGKITSVAFYPYSNCGELLASSEENGRVCLWNIDSGDDRCQQEFTVGMKEVVLCWLRRRGHKTVIIGGEWSGCTELWEVDPPRQAKVFQHLEHESGDYVTAVASSFDGLLVASALSTRHLVIYNVETGDAVYNFPTTDIVLSLQFSPTTNPSMLAFAVLRSTAMHVCYPEGISDRAVSLFEEHRDYVSAVAFSPDGRFIASGAWDNTVNIWEAGVRAISRDKDDNHAKNVTCAHFSNDGQLLVSGSFDGTVRVWDARNGTLQNVLRKPSEAIIDAAFSSDNHCVIFCDLSGCGHLWDWFQDETMAQQKITMEDDYADTSRILPYTHGALGFIHCAILKHTTTMRIDCWTIEQSDGADPRMVLAARGAVPCSYDRVVRISHREHVKADSDITLVLEYYSGERYSAFWRNARAVTDTTEMLQFVEEAGEASSLVGVDITLTSSEAPCYRSDDRNWVLDGQEGRRIMWIPPLNRETFHGFQGQWHWERLALANGPLLLVDFSRAKFDNSPF